MLNLNFPETFRKSKQFRKGTCLHIPATMAGPMVGQRGHLSWAPRKV